MFAAELLSGLKAIIPEEYVMDGYSTDELLGNNGVVAVTPKMEEDIAAILRFANDYEMGVTIMGAGTKRGFGGVANSTDILLSLENYTGIVEHNNGDMTITVKSGSNFHELQEFLRKYNQMIPLDPRLPSHATIGGVIAANDSGPKRLNYGSARDIVIGLKMIYPDGTIMRSGGKTVKNVAGYDMNKLYIGAMGSLGVISEVTIRLRPLPKYESLVLVSFPNGDLTEIYTFTINLLDTILEPTALELLSPSLAEKLTGQAFYTLAIHFEDVESAVRYQIDFGLDHQPLPSKISILEPIQAQGFWNRFSSVYAGEASIKIGVKNIDVLKIIKECQLIQDSYQLMIGAHGGLGHGLCKVFLSGANNDVVSAILHLRSLAEKLGGYAIVTHLPLKQRKQIEVWGEKPPYFSLFDGIKEKVDPKRILNPNRFVGGI